MTTRTAPTSIPKQFGPMPSAAPGAQWRVTDVAAEVTRALVNAWDAIRERHPQVPEAVVSMATGGREAALKLAHFSANRWHTREDGREAHEVFVTAESLSDGGEEVFGSLLHEAAHALNEERGIEDCSVSQYHNRWFRAAAAELGLEQVPDPSAVFKKKFGFARTRPTAATRAAFAEQITSLDIAIRATRARPPASARAGGRAGGGRTAGPTGPDLVPDLDGEAGVGPQKEDRNYRKATCGCAPPTVIRISGSALTAGRVMCSGCGVPFAEAVG